MHGRRILLLAAFLLAVWPGFVASAERSSARGSRSQALLGNAPRRSSASIPRNARPRATPFPGGAWEQETTAFSSGAWERGTPRAAAFPGGAWERGEGESPLTLADLEAIALEHNPTLRQAASQVEAARGARTQAGLAPNPVVGYAASEIGNEGQAGQQGGFIAQEIVTGGKLRLSRAAANQGVRQAELLLEAQRLRVLSAVHIRAYEVLGAERVLALSQELLRLAGQGAEAADALYRAKEVGRPDVLRAQIEVDRARIALDLARNRHQRAWQQLAAVVGMSEMQPAPLAGDLESDVPGLDWETSWQRPIAASPELQVAQAGVRRAGLALRRARAEPVPNLQLQASVQHDDLTRDTIAGVQVGVPLPLFNRNQGAIRAAQAERTRARAEVERVELALRERLAAAFERYQSARQQAERYRDRILPDARESLELVRVGYKAREFDFLQLLTAQRTYFEANLAYVEALVELRRSAVEIAGLLLTDGLRETSGQPPF